MLKNDIGKGIRSLKMIQDQHFCSCAVSQRLTVQSLTTSVMQGYKTLMSQWGINCVNWLLHNNINCTTLLALHGNSTFISLMFAYKIQSSLNSNASVGRANQVTNFPLTPWHQLFTVSLVFSKYALYLINETVGDVHSGSRLLQVSKLTWWIPHSI